MSTERDAPTLIDYVIQAINPVLIMMLVGSLAFLLLEVLYAGAYSSQMRWFLFFFVLGVVLISRVALRDDSGGGRAAAYGLALGFLSWLSLQKFVDYPLDGPSQSLAGLINLGLIALLWWCSHRLTRDCTQVDDGTDAQAEGLLQAAGFEENADPPRDDQEDVEPVSWWERYRRYREQRKMRRTPGVWVVYFSLAALPLFGLGQALIPPAEEERRRYAFWLMTLYVSSGLGLLLTTRLLALRRYLRQRKTEMPANVTASWLYLGGGLIAVLLLAAAVLPRPQSEYPLFDLSGAGSKHADASRQAVRGDNAGEGEGRPKGESRPDGDNGTGTDGKDGADGQDKDGKGGDGGQDKNGQGKGKGKDGQSRDGKEGSSSRSSESGRTPLSSRLLEPLGSLGPILKWIVFGLVVLVVLVMALRSGLQFLAQFLQWARSLLAALNGLLAGLFGTTQAAAATAVDEVEEEEAPQPFAGYPDPFLTGLADSMPARTLLAYTLEALDSWASERGLPRLADETALEFAGRLSEEVPALEADLRALATVHGRVMYTPGGLGAAGREVVRQFWQRLAEVTEQPLSAAE